MLNSLGIISQTGGCISLISEVGSEFSLWSGSIVGKNLEFEENKKIVQQWFFNQDEESIATIKLHVDGESTSVELSHTNIPDEDFENISTMEEKQKKASSNRTEVFKHLKLK